MRLVRAPSLSNSANPDGSLADALPVLRSNGLSLLMSERQQDFDARFVAATTNAALASLDEAVLEADDLMLGLRFDVRPQESNDWFSLQSRISRYAVANGAGEHVIADGVKDEGHLKAHAAVDQGDGQLHADDVVMRWDGWSLAVERPHFHEPVDKPRSGVASVLRCDHKVDGKLPKLRFARSYRLRARVADLAGNGVPVNDSSDLGATSSVFYRRYQPIDPPRVVELPAVKPLPVSERPSAPGESIERVVLRSDFDLDAAAFAARHPKYRVHLSRQVLPPRAPLALAEQHGAFDGMEAERSWRAVQEVFAPRDGDTAADDQLRDFAAVGLQVHVRATLGNSSQADAPRAWSDDWPAPTPKALRVTERRGDEPVLNWMNERNTDTLVVSLAKAQAVMLELSSQPKGGLLDEFAVFEHLSATSEGAVQKGRHPMVSPPNTIELVHAVRRPLRAPEASLALDPRSADQTAIALLAATPLLATDAASCARLELLADWSERVDGINEPRKMTASIQTLAIERGDENLREPFRHDFGDTKHRKVRCVARAHSRFRDCFDDDEDEAAFHVDSARAAEISVPSTARPPPAQALDVVPAFRWRDGAVQGDVIAHRIREGGVLQVELKRPWFETGDGEQLAVIVARGASPPELEAFLTQCGSDPLRGGATAPRFPVAELFAPDTPLHTVWLEEAKAEAGVVGFAPRFDGTHCVADVAIPKLADDQYMPFVRLALARWQPNSLPRLALSPVIHTAFVPLWPRRELIVRRTANGFSVLLQGMGVALVSVAVERLVGASSTANIDLSALTAPAPGVAAWVALDGVGHFGVAASTLNLSLPPGAAGPLRLRIVETDVRNTHGMEHNELNGRVVFADTVDLPT